MTLITKDGTEYGLLAQFREFHGELMRVRYALEVGGRLAERGEDAPDGSELAGRVHFRLRSLLERQAIEALTRGGAYGAELFREAQYLMAALADELLLHRVDWDGRDSWTEFLIENALFGSKVAGERVFERLDALLAENGRLHPELATLYLATLSLGFRGRLWRPTDASELRTYRQRLARAVSRHDQNAGQSEPDHMFPAAYATTLGEGRLVRLPYVRPWLAALAAMLALFTVVTHLVWMDRTAPVERILERGETQAGR